jgi:hypothetical protein
LINLKVQTVKPFVPAKEFEVSLAFYLALGWHALFNENGIAELALEGNSFFLQDYYVKAWANNSMLYVNVEDASAWHEHVSSVLDLRNYGAARTKAPELQEYGDLVTHVWDPCGVLLHFAQRMKE